jgi:hypothetical protein
VHRKDLPAAFTTLPYWAFVHAPPLFGVALLAATEVVPAPMSASAAAAATTNLSFKRPFIFLSPLIVWGFT